MATLNTDDFDYAKQYIDFVFDTVIIPSNVNITSMAYFFTFSIISKFKAKYAKINKIDRSTQVPSFVEELGEKFGISVCTYGELAFIKNAISENPEEESYKNYFSFYKELIDAGFSDAVLEEL